MSSAPESRLPALLEDVCRLSGRHLLNLVNSASFRASLDDVQPGEVQRRPSVYRQRLGFYSCPTLGDQYVITPLE